MRRIVIAAIAGSLLALGAPSAHAAADSDYRGGCGYDSVATDLDQTTWVGQIYSTTVLYSAGTPGDNPVSATVTCSILVNGVLELSATFAGTGLVVGSAPISFVAARTDVVTPCERVDYTSNDTPDRYVCSDSAPIGFPPQPICDAADAVVALVTEDPPIDPDAFCVIM